MTDKYIFYEYNDKKLKVPVERQGEFESRVPDAKVMLTYDNKNYRVPLKEYDTFVGKVGADKLTYSAFDDKKEYVPDLSTDKIFYSEEKNDSYSSIDNENEEDKTSIFETIGKGIGAAGVGTAKLALDLGRMAFNTSVIGGAARALAGKKLDEDLRDENNPLTKASMKLGALQERLSREADPTGGEEGFVDLLKEGKIGMAAQKALGSGIESLPMMVAAGSGIGALLYGSAMAAGNYADETRENPDIPAWKRGINSVGSAALEIAVEKIGGPLKNIGGKAAKEITEEAASEFLKKFAKEGTESVSKRIFNTLKKVGKESLEEGGEELLTSFGNDALGEALDLIDGDKDYGIRAQWEQLKEQNPDADLGEFAKAKGKEYIDAFLGGALSGMEISGTTQAFSEGNRFRVQNELHKDVEAGRALGESANLENLYDINSTVNEFKDKVENAFVDAEGNHILSRDFVDGLNAEQAFALSHSEGLTPEQGVILHGLAKAKAIEEGVNQKFDRELEDKVSSQNQMIEQATENGSIVTALHNGNPVYVKGGIDRNGFVTLPNGENGPVVVIDVTTGEKTTANSKDIQQAISQNSDEYRVNLENQTRQNDANNREVWLNKMSDTAKLNDIKQYDNSKILIKSGDALIQVEVQKILHDGNVLLKGKKGDLGGQSELLMPASQFYDSIARNEDGTPVFVEALPQREENSEENVTDTQTIPAEQQDFRDSAQRILINGVPTDVYVENQDDASNSLTYSYTDENGSNRIANTSVTGFAEAIKEADSYQTEEVAPTENVVEETEISVPEEVQGEPKEIDWDDLFEQDKDAYLNELQNQFGENASEMINGVIEATQQELDSLNKKKGKTQKEIFGNINRKKELQAKIDALNGMAERLTQTTDATVENAEPELVMPEPVEVQMEKDPEPVNGVEFAARELGLRDGGIKLLVDSFKHHTGYGSEEVRKLFGLFRTKEKGGMTLEEAGERLMELDRENGTGFFDQNDPNAGMNAILEALSLNRTIGELRSFTSREQQAKAQSEADAAYSAMMEEYESRLGESAADVIETEEDSDSVIWEESAISDEDYEEFLRIFTDETNEHGTETNERETPAVSGTEEAGNIQPSEGGVEGSSEAGNTVLQAEQPVHTRGEGVSTEESEAIGSEVSEQDAVPSVPTREQSEVEPVAPNIVANPIDDARKKERQLAINVKKIGLAPEAKQDLAYNAGYAVADMFATREEYDAYAEDATDFGVYNEDFERGVDDSFANRNNRQSWQVKKQTNQEADTEPSFEEKLNSIKVSDSDIEFYNNVLDNYKVKHNEVVPTFIVNANSKEDFLLSTGLDDSDLSDEEYRLFVDAIYHGATGRYFNGYVLIFARNDGSSKSEIEQTIFHESIHAVIDETISGTDKIGKWLWENGDSVNDIRFIKQVIADSGLYTDEKYFEEILCDTMAWYMSIGEAQELRDTLPLEYSKIYDDILKEIGYDRRKEAEIRKRPDSESAKWAREVREAIARIQSIIEASERASEPKGKEIGYESETESKGYISDEGRLEGSEVVDDVTSNNSTDLERVIDDSGDRLTDNSRYSRNSDNDYAQNDNIQESELEGERDSASSNRGVNGGLSNNAVNVSNTSRYEGRTLERHKESVERIRKSLEKYALEIANISKKYPEFADVIDEFYNDIFYRNSGMIEINVSELIKGIRNARGNSANDLIDLLNSIKDEQLAIRNIESDAALSEFGISQNEVVPYDTVKNVFDSFSPENYEKILFDRLIDLAKRFDVKIIFTTKQNYDAIALDGVYDGNRNILAIDASLLCGLNPSDTIDITNRLVHELLHSVTTRGFYLKNKYDFYTKAGYHSAAKIFELPSNVKEALEILEGVYASIKNDPAISSEYGVQNVKEMVAELSNPGFRKKLEDNGLWSKVKKAFVKLLSYVSGNKQTSTLGAIEDAVDKLLSELETGSADLVYTSDIIFPNKADIDNGLVDFAVSSSNVTPTQVAQETAAQVYDREVKSNWNEFQRQFQDAFQPVRIAIDAIQQETGNAPIEDWENYLLIQNQSSSRSRNEMNNFTRKYYSPIIKQVNKIIDSIMESRGLKKKDKEGRAAVYNELKRYLIAKHGLERNAYYQNSKGEMRDYAGLTGLFDLDPTEYQDAEAQALDLVNNFESEIGDAARDMLWNKINAATNKTLRHSYESGLLSRQQYDNIKSMFNFYIPLRGFDETTAEDVYAYARFEGNRFNPAVVKTKGRTSLADDPIAIIMNMAESEIAQGNKNRAKQALYNYLLNRASDNNKQNSLMQIEDVWYVISTDANGNKIYQIAAPDHAAGETYEAFDNRMQALAAQGLAEKSKKGQVDVGMRFQKQMNANAHYVYLKINGVDKAIYVNGDPKVADAINGKGAGQLSEGVKMFKDAQRIISSTFTNYSLEFTARNYFRDMIYSHINIGVRESDPAYRKKFRQNWRQNNMRTMLTMLKAYRAGEYDGRALTADEAAFVEFMENGGQTGYTLINSVENHKKDLERAIKRMQEGIENGGVKDSTIFKATLGGIELLNEASELVTRFAAFKTSRDMGRSVVKSISDAKEVTVNFNTKGAQDDTSKNWMGIVSHYFGWSKFFFNASVQGVQNVKAMADANRLKFCGVVGGIAATGFLMPVVISAISEILGGDDEEEYWNIPEYERQNNLCIPLGNGKYAKIALPIGFREVYAIGDMVAAMLMDKQFARDAGQVGMDIANKIASVVLPINPLESTANGLSIWHTMAYTLAPSSAQVLIQNMTNIDWKGAPLQKEYTYNENDPQWMKAFASNPDWMTGLSKWCNEHLKLGDYKGMDWSPEKLDNTLSNLLGGVYTLVKKSGRSISMIWNEENRNLSNIPLAGVALGSGIDSDDRFITDAYYDMQEYYDDNVNYIKRRAEKFGYTLEEVFVKEKGKHHPKMLDIYKNNNFDFMQEWYKGNEELNELNREIKKLKKQIAEKENPSMQLLEKLAKKESKFEAERREFVNDMLELD